MKRETYPSIDVEADGPIPGRNSMLSFGVAAFDLEAPSRQPEESILEAARRPIATFEANLELLDEANPSADTMKWWKTQPEAWDACRKNTQDVSVAMASFVAWVGMIKNPVVIGYPCTYDFEFLHWYTMAFGGIEDGQRCPFGFQGLDIKTMAMTMLNTSFRHATKRNMPKRWFKGSPKHNHEALTDAIGQGVLFVNMMTELRSQKT